MNKEEEKEIANDIKLALKSVSDVAEMYDPKEYTEVFAQSIFDSVDYLIKDFIEFIGSIFVSEDVLDHIEQYTNYNVTYMIISFDQRGYLTKLYNTCKILVAARNSSLISLGYDLDQLDKTFGSSLGDVFYEIVNSNEFIAAINGKMDAIKKINTILVEKYYCDESVGNAITDTPVVISDDDTKLMDVTKQIEEKSVEKSVVISDDKNTSETIPKVETQDASKDTKESATG